VVIVTRLVRWVDSDGAYVAGALSGAIWGATAYRVGGAWCLAAMCVVWAAFAARSWRMR
jgi:hypothetical protein